mmetsp:Transcript_3817/g.8616  ORF Transcript_3817/g.8616 Transcript_3817/m.8616 type:complete len:291 (+) Transcript_3817:1089-1961(+)
MHATGLASQQLVVVSPALSFHLIDRLRQPLVPTRTSLHQRLCLICLPLQLILVVLAADLLHLRLAHGLDLLDALICDVHLLYKVGPLVSEVLSLYGEVLLQRVHPVLLLPQPRTPLDLALTQFCLHTLAPLLIVQGLQVILQLGLLLLHRSGVLVGCALQSHRTVLVHLQYLVAMHALLLLPLGLVPLSELVQFHLHLLVLLVSHLCLGLHTLQHVVLGRVLQRLLPLGRLYLHTAHLLRLHCLRILLHLLPQLDFVLTLQRGRPVVKLGLPSLPQFPQSCLLRLHHVRL